LRFFFWEQSFGRITGENVWKNDTGPFFFIPNIAWSFMPWSLPLFWAFFQELFDLVKRPNYFKNKVEWISLLGLVIPFIALSQSHYKLPHYIYVVFPFASIFTANFLIKLQLPDFTYKLRIINLIQSIVLALVWVLAGLIFLWFFPLENWLLIIVGIFGLLGFTYLVFKEKKNQLKYFLSISLITVLSANVLIACQFYPSILKYQAGGAIGREILKKGISPKEIFLYRLSARSLDVVTHTVNIEKSLPFLMEKINRGETIYIVTDSQGLLDFKTQSYNLLVKAEKPNHSVTLLTLNFLIPKTRKHTLDFYYLVKIKM